MIDSNKKMLIVEDNADMQSLLVNIFDDEGFTTIPVTNGKSGIDKLCSNDIDIVILDKRLPDIDGFNLIPMIKAIKGETKIIILTAYDDVKSRNRAVTLGADAYLTKPFNNFELIKLVKKL
jgi:DNA-binding response OmpR family regulator